jgi:hypothetical protein
MWGFICGCARGWDGDGVGGVEFGSRLMSCHEGMERGKSLNLRLGLSAAIEDLRGIGVVRGGGVR